MDKTSDLSRRRFLQAGVASLGAMAVLPELSDTSDAHDAATMTTSRANAGAIDIRQTAGSQRYAQLPTLSWTSLPSGATADIRITPSARRQEVLGFGAAFTDAACYMFNTLTPEARSELFRELFAPTQMNLTVARTCIGSSDYSTKAYTYDDSDTPDPTLAKFSIAHDTQWILPVLRQARQVNPDIFLLATPWSPPGWMKDNNSLLGGTIRRRYLGVYASYFTKFLEAYAREGVRIDAVSSQNEVDTDQDGNMPACTWPQEIEVQFVGEALGPALARAGLDTKIWLIDHNYNLWGRAIASFDDERVRRYADGVAWHGYLGTPEAMTRVHNAVPQAHAYWTEGGPDYTDPRYLTDWSKWGAQFAGILNNWARCIIAWNYALDEKGRPNIGPFPCGGLVTIDNATHTVTRSGQYWAFAHYSRHVKRGAKVIGSSSAGGASGALAHAAFENPDGSLVMVLTNSRDRVAASWVEVGGSGSRAVHLHLPPDSVTTLQWRG